MDEQRAFDARPIEICGRVVGVLSTVWDEIAEGTGVGCGDFIPKIFGGIWDDDDTGEAFEQELETWDQQPPDMRPLGMLQAMFVSCGYAAQGMKAELRKDTLLAWNYAVRANYWLGVVKGTWALKQDGDGSLKRFSKKAADARHEETRAIKHDVMKWLDENRTVDLNGDDTAGHIAGKVAPIKWRTARDYITEWKKLRSPGKP